MLWKVFSVAAAVAEAAVPIRDTPRTRRAWVDAGKAICGKYTDEFTTSTTRENMWKACPDKNNATGLLGTKWGELTLEEQGHHTADAAKLAMVTAAAAGTVTLVTSQTCEWKEGSCQLHFRSDDPTAKKDEFIGLIMGGEWVVMAGAWGMVSDANCTGKESVFNGDQQQYFKGVKDKVFCDYGIPADDNLKWTAGTPNTCMFKEFTIGGTTFGGTTAESQVPALVVANAADAETGISVHLAEHPCDAHLSSASRVVMSAGSCILIAIASLMFA